MLWDYKIKYRIFSKESFQVNFLFFYYELSALIFQLYLTQLTALLENSLKLKIDSIFVVLFFFLFVAKSRSFKQRKFQEFL